MVIATNGVESPPEEQGEQQPYGAMNPLPRVDYNPQVHKNGNSAAANASGTDQAFSKFLFSQAAKEDMIFGFMVAGNITDDLEKLLIEQLVDIFLLFWEADAFNREGLIAEQRRQAAEHRKAMPQEDHLLTENQKSAEELVSEWHERVAFLTQVWILKRKYGLQHVEKRGYKARTKKARQEIEDIFMQASELPAAHNQYFWCEVRRLTIIDERNRDNAMGLYPPDYTDLKKRIQDGTPVNNVVTEMPWPFRLAYSRVYKSMLDGETYRNYLGALYIGQWRDQPRQENSKQGWFGFRPRRGNRNNQGSQGQQNAQQQGGATPPAMAPTAQGNGS